LPAVHSWQQGVFVYRRFEVFLNFGNQQETSAQYRMKLSPNLLSRSFSSSGRTIKFQMIEPLKE
jgi:hypothetical protein